MPGMDGFQVAEAIREHPRFQHPPIIFMTSYGSEEIGLARGYRRGAVDFLFTPIVPEALRSNVQMFIDLARRVRQVLDA